MRIQLNETTLNIADTTRLCDLLKSEAIDTNAIAVARNGHIVHREHWTRTQLQEDDTITIVQAVAGG